jgi:3-keto-L-gulonate-6-phosphate decarboxylase
LRERLFVLHGIESHDPEARQHALFALLREHRTGARPLPGPQLEAIVAEAASGAWLPAREARHLAAQPAGTQVAAVPWSAQRDYRRHRGARVVQVALDLPDLERAVLVAEAAARAGAELIEIGDPLIKEFGIDAVARVKRAVPHVTVVAEMMSADWGRDQVVLAAQAGADIAFLIGPATAASVAAAVAAGRRMGVPVVLDVPMRHVTQDWVQEMESVGVDGFAVTTNIDLGVAGSHPFAAAEKVRAWSRLPVAVSGGFSPTDQALLANPHWDIVVVGRSVAEAVNPKAAAAQVIAATRTQPSEP